MTALTAAQRDALTVLAYADRHRVAAETGRTTRVEFPRTLPPGRSRISAGAARTLIAAGLAATVTGLPGCRLIALTDAGRQVAADLDLAEVPA